MSRSIKFNLILKGNPITNLDELKSNFSISEMIWYYHNGLLKKWLDVRDLTEYSDSIRKITSLSNKEILNELIEIFDIDMSKSKIDDEIVLLNYNLKKKFFPDEIFDEKYKNKEIISNYHKGYCNTIDSILKNKDNLQELKNLFKLIEEEYMECFKLNYRDLYYDFIDNAPLAICAIILNNSTKDCFIAEENSKADVKEIHNNLNKFNFDSPELKEKLGSELDKIQSIIKNKVN
ncbi:hypothetical protein ACQPU1_02140 [Clostridium paraputrificum]|uniref:hypothetical protein n=1 Tax=Clostridium paraputrificum TaxID=29363 RepID=UPI003D34DA23